MSETTPSNVVAHTWCQPLKPPMSIPASADVVIIGGGIVGVSTAWFLSRAGVNVVLCEKGHIAGEQSGRNWGWVRQQGRDPREMPMIIESVKIWRTLQDEIGEDVGYTQTGCTYAARDDDELEQYVAWLRIAEEFGLDSHFLSSDEISQHVRGATASWKGAIHTPSDGSAEPHKATPAIARAAARNGASILTACAVRGLETEAGRVSGVVTEYGRIKAPVVLCAGGAWTSMFCRSLGISVPQIAVRGTVVRTSPDGDLLNGALWEDKTGIRRRQDGGYTVADSAIFDHSITPNSFRHALKFLPLLRLEFRHLRLSIGRDFMDEWKTPRKWSLDTPSPFEKTRVLNPDPDPRVLKRIRKNLDTAFPLLADSEILEAWAGMIESTPDVVPIIEETARIPGFHIATGFSGHGFGIGPGAGKAIADMITGALVALICLSSA